MDPVAQQTLIKEYYWDLVKWDGEVIPVRPAMVDTIKKKLATGEGFIMTKTRSIAVKDIKDFVQTDRVYTEQKLLEAGARAFNEPIIVDQGSLTWQTDGPPHGKSRSATVHYEAVQARWVKKVVTRRRWDNYYSAGSYKKLSEEENQVVVAFKLPVHEIDPQLVEECTPSEISRLG